MVVYEKRSTTKIYRSRSPEDLARSWPIPVTVGMFGVLFTESGSKSDDSQEDSTFQTPSPCVTVGIFESAKG